MSISSGAAAEKPVRSPRPPICAGVDLLLLQFSPQIEQMERFSDSVMRRAARH